MKRAKKPTEEALTYEEHEARNRREQASRIQKLKQKYEDAGLCTIGVRFGRDPGREYTYLVKLNKVIGVYLGMELVVKDSAGFSKCCYVTRIDDDIVMPLDYDGELKEVTQRVGAL